MKRYYHCEWVFVFYNFLINVRSVSLSGVTGQCLFPHPPSLREILSSRSISIISESLPLSSPPSVVNSDSSWFSSFLNPFLERLDISLAVSDPSLSPLSAERHFAESANIALLTCALFRKINFAAVDLVFFSRR